MEVSTDSSTVISSYKRFEQVVHNVDSRLNINHAAAILNVLLYLCYKLWIQIVDYDKFNIFVIINV